MLHLSNRSGQNSASYLLLVFYSCVSGYAQTTGGITGTVRSGSNGMGRVNVVAHRQGSRPLQSFGGITSADGTYSISGMPVGRYVLCVPAPGKDLQDPCIWASRAQEVDVAAGQTARAPLVTVQPTTVIRIRILDPQQHLQKAVLDLKAPSLWLSLTNGAGIRFSPVLVRSDVGSQTYELAVSQGQTYRLETASADVTLQSAAGNAVARLGSSDGFTVSATSQHEFSFVVSQRK